MFVNLATRNLQSVTFHISKLDYAEMAFKLQKDKETDGVIPVITDVRISVAGKVYIIDKMNYDKLEKVIQYENIKYNVSTNQFFDRMEKENPSKNTEKIEKVQENA